MVRTDRVKCINWHNCKRVTEWGLHSRLARAHQSYFINRGAGERKVRTFTCGWLGWGWGLLIRCGRTTRVCIFSCFECVLLDTGAHYCQDPVSRGFCCCSSKQILSLLFAFQFWKFQKKSFTLYVPGNFQREIYSIEKGTNSKTHK